MLMWGERHVIRRNLVTRVMFPGSWGDRQEERIQYDAGVELQEASDLVVIGNVVAGSERAGFRTDGNSCDKLEMSSAELFAMNEAHSCLIGVMVLGDGIKPCSVLNGFKSWKSWYFGMYLQSEVKKLCSNMQTIYKCIHAGYRC